MKEYILSKQIMPSGTAIGAMVREWEHAESKPDFIHKRSVALNEAIELRSNHEYLEFINV